MSSPAHEFRGTARFEVLGRLGQGGMGTVYAAFDRERGLKVAVKSLSASLSEMDAERLRMFKQEFRAIQDLQHPNLVQLGELVEVEGHWFFTMELVEGMDFMSFVRAAPGDLTDEDTSDAEVPESSLSSHAACPGCTSTGKSTAISSRRTILNSTGLWGI